MLTTPDTCAPRCAFVDVQHNESGTETIEGIGLALAQSSDDLLDVDGGGRGDITGATQVGNPCDGGSTAQEVDQHR
ncbi:MAG: hypothetical protein WKF79_16390 [Nocardioides sp.]